jgi:uncharacterized protein (DUF2141 family)
MIRLLYLVPIFLLAQCARTTQPNGGPKDVDPPQLLNSNPKNGQKNFTGKNIELEFDEYIKLKDAKEEILVTPTSGPDTKFLAKKNKLTITPQLDWKENTTYSIVFRDGVQDINEGNPADELHLAFSTGDMIDSLRIYGSVNEAFMEKIPEKITIAAYNIDTFDIFKHKPTYFTKTDKKGRFTIQNLKPGQYFLYAFEDKNKNFKVDSKSEKYGFNVNPINIPESNDSVRLTIFHCDARGQKITTVRNTNTISTIRFNKPVSDVKLQSDKPILYCFGDTKGEVVVYKDFDQKDSILVRVSTRDSLLESMDTTIFIKYTDSKKVEEKLKQKEWNIKFNIETKILTAETEFSKIIKSANKDSIYIQIDSTTINQIKDSDISFDTLRKKLTISKKLNVANEEEKRPNPVLLLGKGAFVSIDDDSTKSQSINIKIPKTAEVGMMSVEIKTAEPHYIISLINSNNKVEQTFTDQKKFTFTNIPAGEYKIQILIDSNNDGQWNPGNFKKQTQPEKVFYYKFLGKKYSEPIRANWEVGPFLITF